MCIVWYRIGTRLAKGLDSQLIKLVRRTLALTLQPTTDCHLLVAHAYYVSALYVFPLR